MINLKIIVNLNELHDIGQHGKNRTVIAAAL